MQNMFPLTWIQIQIPFPNGNCTHFRNGSLSQGQIYIPITYISTRGSNSESEPMEKSCIVQEAMFESKSESESGNGNKPLLTYVYYTEQGLITNSPQRGRAPT